MTLEQLMQKEEFVIKNNFYRKNTEYGENVLIQRKDNSFTIEFYENCPDGDGGYEQSFDKEHFKTLDDLINWFN